MLNVLIQDYLNTQGLPLSEQDVKVAYLTAQTVINMDKASIDRQLLWYSHDDIQLSKHIEQNEDNEALLKQVFMVLDSVYSRAKGLKSAVIYALMSSAQQPYLLRLAQQGIPIEQMIPISDDSGWHYLPSRVAQTGWLNISNDVKKWLDLQEIKGEHHQRSASQMTIPICGENGVVLGVVHLEHGEKEAFNDEMKTEWVALALALIDPLRALLRQENENLQEEDAS